jgi:predicted TIM-barrel enzyme
MFTTPYVFNIEEAKQMTKAGADLIVAHMGLTVAGTIGAKTFKSLDQSVKEIQAITDAAKTVRPDVMVICHGGPIAQPADAQYIMDRVKGVDGFYGASSMERLPTEIALTEQVKKFTSLKLNNRAAGVR